MDDRILHLTPNVPGNCLNEIRSLPSLTESQSRGVFIRRITY